MSAVADGGKEEDDAWQILQSSDLLLNTLAAAVYSYRRATVCVPFPKDFEVQGSRDYAALQQCLDSLRPNAAILQNQHRRLLEWTLYSHPRRKASSFLRIPLEQFFDEIPEAQISGSQAVNTSLHPHAVFKLRREAQLNISGDVDSFLDDQNSIKTAFHGTSFENLHSILRSGLVPASGTRLERTGAVFGPGIYMSTSLQVAYSFCQNPENTRWQGSSLAPDSTCLRCVLVCSVKFDSSSSNMDSSLPDHYIVVERPDFISIRYLILYLDTTRGGKRRGDGGAGGAAAASASLLSSSPLSILLSVFLTFCVCWVIWENVMHAR